MRPVELHPLSVLVGLAVACVAFLAMAQSPQALDPTLHRPGSHAVIAPRDMVQVQEGTPLTVPIGKFFVLTGLGNTNAYQTDARLSVNGTQVVNAYGGYVWSSGDTAGNATSMKSVPIGLAVPAGSLVEVTDAFSQSTAQAWGYLADA